MKQLLTLIKRADDEPTPCHTLSVPDAGRRYFNIGKNASYHAVKAGVIPVIKVGRLLRVPIVAMERKMEEAGRS